jgi:hypothetical protein
MALEERSTRNFFGAPQSQSSPGEFQVSDTVVPERVAWSDRGLPGGRVSVP